VFLSNASHSLLYLPENVTQVARQRGQLFTAKAEDYFFIAFNDFPWNRVPALVIGRRAYDNYLVGLAIQQSVAVVDATATLLAVHQTDREGNFAGHGHKDTHVNAVRIGKFDYSAGFSTSAQYVTKFTDDEVCNCTMTKVTVVIRKPRITTRSRVISTTVSMSPPPNERFPKEARKPLS